MLLPRATDSRLRLKNASGVPFACSATGVGHPVQPLPDVRRADARSAYINRPAGVIRCFQIMRYSIPPPQGSRACNLFAKDRARAALADEPEEHGPQVPVVGFRESLAGVGKWLAGAGTRPDGPVVGPSSQAKGKRPAPDPGEEVALDVSGELAGVDVCDASFVNSSMSYVSFFHERPQHMDLGRVELVVVGGHCASSNSAGAGWAYSLLARSSSHRASASLSSPPA